MLTSPLTRPLHGPLATALTDARASAPAEAGTTWDAANKTANVTLSGANLIASSVADGADASAVVTTFHATGKYHFRVLMTCVANSEGSIRVGLVPEGWTLGVLGADADSYALTGAGAKVNAGAAPSISRSVPSGSYFDGWVDFDNRLLWFGNEASGPSGDPEAGTGEAFALPPDIPFAIAVSLYSDDGTTPSTGTLQFVSSGTYAAWS